MRPIAIILLPTLAALPVLSGCATAHQTDPPRTANEIFLHSVAAGQAADGLEAELLAGRTVYIDATSLPDAEEHRFMIGQLRANLLQADARLVASPEDAEVIVTAYSGGLGVDRYDFLLGIPIRPVLLLAGGEQQDVARAPEQIGLRDSRNYGTAGLNYVAYWAETGDILAHSGPAYGRSILQRFGFLGGVTAAETNIPTQPDVDEDD